MKIVILGAGQVGSSVAEVLAGEDSDITLVDQNADLLRELADRLDIQTVEGFASYPSVLASAGLDDADVLLAVTNSDEVNMAACQIAHSVFHTPKKIARIRAPEYLEQDDLFQADSIPIDVIISPEELVSARITRVIEQPGALQVLDFADGLVQMVALKASTGGPMVGHQLRELKDHIPRVDTRVVAIFRRDRAIALDAGTVIEDGDEVFFLAARKHIRKIMGELRRLDSAGRRIIIAGGGNIGHRLAVGLQGSYKVKLIERSKQRARNLAEELDDVIVLSGDAGDKELLLEENVDRANVFCAVTNDDQVNILSAMLAKKLGAKRVMALINRGAFVDLIESSAIDVAFSPSQATIGGLLRHIRRGDVVKVHSLRRGAAEAIEAVAHGDQKSSQVVGRRLDQIDLPPGTTIGAVVRGTDVLIAHHDVEIHAKDHVILFVTRKRYIPQVERLFQVSATFF